MRKSLNLFILGFALCTLHFALLSPAFAQNPTPTPTMFYLPIYGQNANGSLFSVPQSPFIITPETLSQQLNTGQVSIGPFTTSVLTGTASNLLVAIGGSQQLAYDQNGKPYYTYQGGAAEIVGNLTSYLYTSKPASSVEYFADLGSSLGIVKPAYAQGLGFTALSPLLKIWKIFRNITYLFFVVIFIIIGFMVMFRKKIDPRTVVTIQDALPRIVVTLILVTFSYAIAGLIIDLGDFATKLVAITFSNENLIANPPGATADPLHKQDYLNKILNSNVISLTNQLRIPTELAAQLSEIQLVSNGQPGPALPSAFASLANITVWLILTIAGFYVMFKIFFALIGPYVSIILSIIFAPFVLLKSAIPGSEGGVASWLTELIAKVAVFPVTFSLLAIAAILKGTNEASTFKGTDWYVLENDPSNPSLNWAPTLLGSFGPIAGKLAAFGILFAIPRIAEAIQEAFKVKPGIMPKAAESELRGAFGNFPILKNIVK